MSNSKQPELKEILLNPPKYFNSPKELLNNNSFSKQEKIEILKRWEYDAKELEIADDENMANTKNNNSDILDEILNAINYLNKKTSC